MATDFTVYLDDRPGTVATVGNTLGAAGVNVLGGFALVVGGQGIMHVLVEDADTAVQALAAAGFEVRDEQEVLLLDIEDRPGALGEVAGKIADAGVNVTAFYLATGTRVVLCADDLDAARRAVGA